MSTPHASRSKRKPPVVDSVSDGTLRRVHLLQAKDSLCKDIKLALDNFSGSRSKVVLLQKRVDETEPEKVAQLLTKPADILKTIDTELVAPLKALDSCMPALPLVDVDGKKALHGTTWGATSLAHPRHKHTTQRSVLATHAQ